MKPKNESKHKQNGEQEKPEIPGINLREEVRKYLRVKNRVAARKSPPNQNSQGPMEQRQK